MAKYEWSEVFMSIEGEAAHAGKPTVYARFARCNFQCKGFNNPENLDTTNISVLGFDPKTYKDIYTIPLITKGCDSIYSWDEKFSHMWKKGDEYQLIQEVVNVLPYNSFEHPITKQRVIFSLTGGEPTSRLKTWMPLIKEAYKHGMRHILIETNCSVPLKPDLIDALYDFATTVGLHITWSNSPKIGSSGEPWNKAIKPSVAISQVTYKGNQLQQRNMKYEQYFKFVCGDVNSDFDDVARAMDEYYSAGIDKRSQVWIMPVACSEEQQQNIAAKIAQRCIKRGYIYCHRLQNSVFGNGVGT